MLWGPYNFSSFLPFFLPFLPFLPFLSFSPLPSPLSFLFKDFLYLFMRDTEKEAEGEADSMQGARCGTRSQDLRISPEPKADAQPLSHTGLPGENQFVLCI